MDVGIAETIREVPPACAKVRLTYKAPYCVRLYHVGPVQSGYVSSHTLAPQRKAAELGGNYDGWETQVLAPGASN